jgi:hypothetical protein
MKGFAFLLFLAGCLVLLASAQDEEHVQVGVFADYFRLAQNRQQLRRCWRSSQFSGL